MSSRVVRCKLGISVLTLWNECQLLLYMFRVKWKRTASFSTAKAKCSRRLALSNRSAIVRLTESHHTRRYVMLRVVPTGVYVFNCRSCRLRWRRRRRCSRRRWSSSTRRIHHARNFIPVATRRSRELLRRRRRLQPDHCFAECDRSMARLPSTLLFTSMPTTANSKIRSDAQKVSK